MNGLTPLIGFRRFQYATRAGMCNRKIEAGTIHGSVLVPAASSGGSGTTAAIRPTWNVVGERAGVQVELQHITFCRSIRFDRFNARWRTLRNLQRRFDLAPDQGAGGRIDLECVMGRMTAAPGGALQDRGGCTGIRHWSTPGGGCKCDCSIVLPTAYFVHSRMRLYRSRFRVMPSASMRAHWAARFEPGSLAPS